MIRRLLVVAATAVAALLATAPAHAESRTVRSDTNGCVVIIPAEIAVCIGRL